MSAFSTPSGVKLGSTSAGESKSSRKEHQAVLGCEDYLLSNPEDQPTTEGSKVKLIYFYQTETGADTDDVPVSSVKCPDGTRRSVYQTKDNGATLYSNNLKSPGTGFSAKSMESAELFNDALEAKMKRHLIEGIKGTELEEFPPGSNVSDCLFALALKEQKQTPDALYKWIDKQHKKSGSKRNDFGVVFADNLQDFLDRGEEYTDADSAARPKAELNMSQHQQHLKNRWGNSKVGKYKGIKQPKHGLYYSIPVVQAAGSDQSQD